MVKHLEMPVTWWPGMGGPQTDLWKWKAAEAISGDAAWRGHGQW